MGYLYYHGCSILIDSSTNKLVYIHGVGRVQNSDYSSGEAIPHCVFSQDSFTWYSSNDVYAKPFHNLKKNNQFLIEWCISNWMKHLAFAMKMWVKYCELIWNRLNDLYNHFTDED